MRQSESRLLSQYQSNLENWGVKFDGNFRVSDQKVTEIKSQIRQFLNLDNQNISLSLQTLQS